MTNSDDDRDPALVVTDINTRGTTRPMSNPDYANKRIQQIERRIAELRAHLEARTDDARTVEGLAWLIGQEADRLRAHVAVLD